MNMNDERRYSRMALMRMVGAANAFLANAGTSEGAKKGWEHRTRGGAAQQLRQLRDSGYKGKVSIERDPSSGLFFLRKKEGEIGEKKPEITPYDKEIRRMKRFGTQDIHGALADTIYEDKKARDEFEGDQPGASWEDASADLARNYLYFHGIKT